MDFSTTLVDGYVSIVVFGVYEFAKIRGLVAHALVTAVRNSKCHVLLDFRNVEGEPSVLERFGMGVEVSGLQKRIKGAMQVTLVLVGQEPFLDPRGYDEVVAVNRGANLRVFRDLEAAQSYIREGSVVASAI